MSSSPFSIPSKMALATEMFDCDQVAQVVKGLDAGVVDEDVERSGLLGSGPDLRRVGHVQGDRSDALTGAGQGLARARVHPPGAP